MKKLIVTALTLLTLCSLFTGCRRKMDMMPTTVPTRATVSPVYPTTTSPSVGTAPRETIEDGNGPIPSQRPTMK